MEKNYLGRNVAYLFKAYRTVANLSSNLPVTLCLNYSEMLIKL